MRYMKKLVSLVIVLGSLFSASACRCKQERLPIHVVKQNAVNVLPRASVLCSTVESKVASIWMPSI